MTKFFSDLKHLESDASHLGLHMKLDLAEAPLPEGLLELAAETNARCWEAQTAFTIYAFSEGAPYRGILFTLHGHADEGKLTHFQITITRKPEGTPPDEIVAGNRKTGGFPEVLKRVFPMFNQLKLNCHAEASFFSRTSPIKIFPTEKRKSDLSLAEKKLIFKSHPNEDSTDTVTISMYPSRKESVAKVEATFEIMLSEECIESAADTLWKKAASLYTHE